MATARGAHPIGAAGVRPDSGGYVSEVDGGSARAGFGDAAGGQANARVIETRGGVAPRAWWAMTPGAS